MLAVYFLGLIISFYLLYFFSEHFFIPVLDTIGKKLKMTSDIAGATLMAAGSSAPELAVVIISIVKSGNHEAIGVGTIVGSALFNLFIIVGAVMVLGKNLKLQWQPLIRDLFFYAISVVLLVVFFRDGSISLVEAILFIGMYLIYFVALYNWKKIFPYKDLESGEQEKRSSSDLHPVNEFLYRLVPKVKNIYLAFFLIVLTISFLSWVLVECAIGISSSLGIPEVIIALTVLAVGTSVPDLISSAIVAKQGRPGMAINNAIGSNIFDILIGLGLPFLLLFIFKSGSMTVSSGDLKLSFVLLMGSIIIMTVAMIAKRWKTSALLGYVFVGIYLMYIAYEISCSMGLPVCHWVSNWFNI